MSYPYLGWAFFGGLKLRAISKRALFGQILGGEFHVFIMSIRVI